MITFLKKPDKEEDILKIFNPHAKEWFLKKFKSFSEPQKYSILRIHNKENILVSSPTGSGKTLTAFLSILNELITLSENNLLEDRIYAIYISPLKALSNDIFFNLEQPLKEIEELADKKFNIRVSVRTGDTSTSEKQKMLKKSPHIFITTPESFSLLLTSVKFMELMRNAKYVIVDEIHALAENKRGSHLSLSLEILNYLKGEDFTRIGLSATISPLEEVAGFLVGSNRNCSIADISFNKKMDLKVLSPVKDLINTTYEETSSETYNLLNRLIQDHKTTLVFTNTRSATERVVHNLKEKFPELYAENIAAHHGSLDKTHRLETEKRMREGKLKCIVCSTSLELGIDIGFIDLVILLGSPKSVARAMQRCLPYNSRILLSDGTYKKIGEIVENKINAKILSYDKGRGFIENRIIKYHKDLSKELIKIILHSGLELECTNEHPLLTKKGWKLARNININDEIAEIFNFEINNVPFIYEVINQKYFYIENREDFLRDITDKYVRNKNISYTEFAKIIGIKQNHLQNYLRKKGKRKGIRSDIFLKIMKVCRIKKVYYLNYLREIKSKSWHRRPIPLKFNKDFMWLSGIVASDGSITQHKITKEYKIKIGNKDIELLKECQKIFNEYGFYPNILKNKNNFYTLECGSRLLSEMMLVLGIKKGKKSHVIEISDILNKFPKELFIPYLEGVLEGDGNVNDNIRIFSASRNFIVGIHNRLNRIGIYNYFKKDEAKVSRLIRKINNDEIYCLYISRNKHVKDFVKYCTFRGKKSRILKNKKFPIYKKDNDIDKNICWTRVLSIKKDETENPVYNITLESSPNNYFVESILTHNCGRAGHRLHDEIKGRIIVLDRDDLVECSVLLKNVIEKKIDKIHIPKNPLDVLAQQVYAMAIISRFSTRDLFNVIKKAYPYRDIEMKEFREILDYLAGEYNSLEDRHVYAKIWYDKENEMIGKRGKLARVIYMTNIGTIPEESMVKVKINNQVIGTIDESFLERLKPGDVFVLGGSTYTFRYSRGQTVQVSSSVQRPPTVPSWFSEMLPLSFDLALEIGRFRHLMSQKISKPKEEVIDFINEYLYIDEYGAEAIYSYFNEQYLFTKEIPTNRKILIEHYSSEDDNKIIFHTLFGRRVNDCLSRALAYAIYRLSHKEVEIGINDNGFYVSGKKIQAFQGLNLIKSNEIRKILDLAINNSEVLKRRFRHCAVRSLMILRSYKGKSKRVGKQQISSMLLINAVKRISNDFPILKEARREVLEDSMDINSLKIVLERIEKKEIEVKEIYTKIPSPFAFNIALQGRTDMLRMEDKVKFLKDIHRLVLMKIENP